MATFNQVLSGIKESIREVSPEQVSGHNGNAAPVILDVRERDEYEQGHVPGAEWIPRGFLELKIEDLVPDRERELVILRAGWQCNSEYEWAQHNRIGLEAGLSAEEIERVKTGGAADGWSAHHVCLDAGFAHGLCEHGSEFPGPGRVRVDDVLGNPAVSMFTRRIDEMPILDECSASLDDGPGPGLSMRHFTHFIHSPYAYECRPEMVKLMMIQLKSITAQPMMASTAVQSPLSPDLRRVWIRMA